MSRQEPQIINWLQETDDEEEEELKSSEDEEDQCQEEAHMSDSEQEEYEGDTTSQSTVDADLGAQETDDSSDDDYPLSNLQCYTARSGIEWKKLPFRTSVRTRSSNIRRQICGPEGAAKECKTSVSCFNLYVDDEMVNIITKCTNIYINKIRIKYSRERDAKPTDPQEIRGLIGVLIMMRANKGGRRIVKDFWDNKYGTAVESIYLTMAQSRFIFLLKCLRFDDLNTRERRREIDKLAPIRILFEKFVSNCKKYYTPSDYLTLDEQLVAFRGRCGFRMFIPNKPDKYGLKLFALVDVQFPYAYNLEVYLGTQPIGPYQLSNKVPDVVHRMLSPIRNMGCNVTMDNWFSSIPVFLELEQQNITAIGTLKSNKPDIPQIFKTSKGRPVADSLFGFQKKCTLVSYVPKQNKVVLVASTMHNDNTIDMRTGDAKKPEIITEYNRTKCGVDVLDKMCKHFSVARNSRRWPLTLFYNIINISGINGFIIDTMVNNNYQRKSRRDYLRSVAFELMLPLMKQRLHNKTLPRELRERGMLFLNEKIDDMSPNQPTPSTKRTKTARCYDCGRAKDRSTRTCCENCFKPVCNDHKHSLCLQCYTQTVKDIDVPITD